MNIYSPILQNDTSALVLKKKKRHETKGKKKKQKKGSWDPPFGENGVMLGVRLHSSLFNLGKTREDSLETILVLALQNHTVNHASR